ncbi:hypothetical protein RFI_32347, partial [Reticulomyxa filosa]
EKGRRKSMEFLEKVRDVFEYFDRNMDGTLTIEDTTRMMPLVSVSFGIDQGRKWFDPPCDFIKFLSRLQTLGQEITKPMLDRLILHMQLRVADVFYCFTRGSHQTMSEEEFLQMYGYSFKKELDWRRIYRFPCSQSDFLRNWGHLGVFEQHGILAEAEKRLMREVNRIIHTNFKKLTKDIFNFYDPNNGYLTRETCQELLQAVNEDIRQVDVFFSPPCSFDRFLIAWDLLQRSLTRDILPTLQLHIRQVTFFLFLEFHFILFIFFGMCVAFLYNFAMTNDRLALPETSRYLFVSFFFFLSNMNFFFFSFTGLDDTIGRSNTIQFDGSDDQGLRKRPGRGKVREKNPALGKALGRRPSVTDLMGKNILWNDPADIQSQINERLLHRSRTSEILDRRLSERPDITSLVERGIIIDINDSFGAEAGAAMQRVHMMGLGERERRAFSSIITDLLTQHNITVQEMNQRHIERMKEQRKLHDEAYRDARSREKKLRNELDNRSRLIAHNKGQIEKFNKEKKELQQEMTEEIKKMKDDYEEQIRILQESMRIPISTSASNTQQIGEFKQYLQGLLQTLQQLKQGVTRFNDGNCASLANTALYQAEQLSAVHNHHLENQKKELTDTFQVQMNGRKEIHDEEFVKLQEHFDNVLNAKALEIEKLRQQKKEISQMVEKKLQNLQYVHEKEIEKERNIIAMLQQNLKDQKEAFVKQAGEKQNATKENKTTEKEQIIQLMTQVQNITQVNRQVIAENEKLKKSKSKLEQQILVLSDQIVQMCK